MAVFNSGSDYQKELYTLVDNVFIGEYLCNAPEKAVKVYLYGLYLLQHAEQGGDAETIAATLNLTAGEFKDSLDYWESMGLIEYIDRAQLKVRFLPVRASSRSSFKYKPSKYADFNQNMQDLFPDRIINPAEYEEYYYLIESRKIDPSVLYMIAAYCVRSKGGRLRYPYIIAVAKDWLAAGITTVDAVEARLQENECATEAVKRIMRAIKCNSVPDLDDKQLYNKWTAGWGYDMDGILQAAQLIKRGNMSKLDAALDRYYRNGVFTAQEMCSFAEKTDNMNTIAREVAKRLGISYADYDYITEIYVTKWLQNGFEYDGLTTIAHNAMLSGVRTLAGFDAEVQRLYNEGYVDASAISAYYGKREKANDSLKTIINLLGSARLPNERDRENYRVWTQEWGFDDDALNAAAGMCAPRSQSMSFLNNFLSRCKMQGAFTAQDVLRCNVLPESNTATDGRLVQSVVTEESAKALSGEVTTDFDEIE